jgi:hypothetical protein
VTRSIALSIALLALVNPDLVLGAAASVSSGNEMKPVAVLI